MTERQFPLQEHLGELRKRLMLAAIAVIVSTSVAYIFHKKILLFLLIPAEGFLNTPTGKPIVTELTEFISTAMKASLLVGLIGSFPFVLFQVFMFVSPGLKPGEKRYLYILLPISLFVFVLGVGFGFQILVPIVEFLETYGSDIVDPTFRIGPYISRVLSLLIWMGLLFEMPLVLFFLARIGVVTPRLLARQRRYAIVIAFILGALITPTVDPFNQIIVAVPIILLYEMGIWLAKLGARIRNRGAAASEVGVDSEVR